jgi:hypothetical protein
MKAYTRFSGLRPPWHGFCGFNFEKYKYLKTFGRTSAANGWFLPPFYFIISIITNLVPAAFSNINYFFIEMCP